MFIFTPQGPKMKKITISSDLSGLPWQHGIYDRNFKQVFLNNNKKMKKITISSDLLGLPWQHGI